MNAHVLIEGRNIAAVIDFGLGGARTGSSLPHMEGQWREGALDIFEAPLRSRAFVHECRKDPRRLPAQGHDPSRLAGRPRGLAPRSRMGCQCLGAAVLEEPVSPYDGRRLRAHVSRTIVAGQTVFADGQVLVEPGHGQFVSSAAPATLGNARPVSKYHHRAVDGPLSSAVGPEHTTGADRGA